jgi:PDZ domain-containing protein
MVIAEVDTLDTIVTPPPLEAQAAPAMPPRRWSVVLVIVAALMAAVLLGASLLKVPYFAIAPGDASSVELRVSVSGVTTYPADNDTLFVTVGVPRLTRLAKWAADLDSHVDVVPEKAILGDQTESENRQENLRLMTYSKDFATYVALTKLGYPVTVKGGGVVVKTTCLQLGPTGTTCTKDSPNAKVLKAKDVITAVDGKAVNLIPDLTPALAGHKPGDTVTLGLLRDAKAATARATLIRSDDGRTIIGFVPEQSPPDTIQFGFPIQIKIDSGEVGGPSAGLAFTLTLLDVLTPGSITGGNVVAATGQITPTGAVEPIGGIFQKTIAVARTKAKVFLIPKEQGEIDAAQRAAKGTDVRIVPVATVDEALHALATLGGNAEQLGTPGATAAGG